ncbi:MAG: hypothetical protein ACJ76S_07365 [Solirubrobacteraceae bacterium]
MSGGGLYDDDLRRGLPPAQVRILEAQAGEVGSLTATLRELARDRPEEHQALEALERRPYDSLGAEQVLDIARLVLAGRG